MTPIPPVTTTARLPNSRAMALFHKQEPLTPSEWAEWEELERAEQTEETEA